MPGREKTQTSLYLNIRKVRISDSWGFSLEQCNDPLVFSLYMMLKSKGQVCLHLNSMNLTECQGGKGPETISMFHFTQVPDTQHSHQMTVSGSLFTTKHRNQPKPSLLIPKEYRILSTGSIIITIILRIIGLPWWFSG